MTIGIEHVNDYPLIRFEILFEFEFLAVYSIRDSIRTEISDSQVPRLGLCPAERYPANRDTLYVLSGVCSTATI